MGAPRHILIVDDNVELAENIAEILQMDGHSTAIAASAEAALPLAQAREPDVLVTDYRLPGMTGATLAERFRRERAHVVAVVISAYTDDGTIGAATDAGAKFMAKPVDYQLLSRLVREGAA